TGMPSPGEENVAQASQGSQPKPEEAIADAALDLAPAQRDAYLERACAANPDLRQLVDALLRAQQHLGAAPVKADPVAAPGEQIPSTGPTLQVLFKHPVPPQSSTFLGRSLRVSAAQ